MEKIKKEDKEKIMGLIKKAGDPTNYETSYDEKGAFHNKLKTEIKKGKRARSRGLEFEIKVRRHLESMGRIVDKWTNNVDLETGKIIPAKKNWKFNPFRSIMMPSAQGTGFPDFIAFRKTSEGLYNIVGVEVKTNGILSKIEKEKCGWYLQNGIFSEVWIAKAVKKGRNIEIEYENFLEKYGDKYNNV